jgi:hypothetical protein
MHAFKATQLAFFPILLVAAYVTSRRPHPPDSFFLFLLAAWFVGYIHCRRLAESISLSAMRKPLLLEGSAEGGNGAATEVAQLSLLWPAPRCKPRLGHRDFE